MSLTQWGFVGGVVVSVVLALFMTGGGAGIVFFVPFFAIVLGPLGALLGWLIARFVRGRPGPGDSAHL